MSLVFEQSPLVNRLAKDQILAVQEKLCKGLGKPITLHRDAGHVTSFKVLEAWRRALQ